MAFQKPCHRVEHVRLAGARAQCCWIESGQRQESLAQPVIGDDVGKRLQEKDVGQPGPAAAGACLAT